MEGTYINIVGDNKEEIAKAIADHFRTKVVKDGDNIAILVDQDVEVAFCISEDMMMQTIEELNAEFPNIHLTPENLDF